ncbi:MULTISPECIES: nuclear transport factor 2 family protein [unclassified Pseudomonas]|uniref:nuclear transport factor 2 family protein n=1 Tax=unclassified Pseudomonas TaxID=196821 RepID=UPI003850D0D5
MNIETLSARLEALESRAAIDRLISAYANAFDRVDAALLRDIWHLDASLELPGFGSAQGRDGILAMAQSSWRQMPACGSQVDAALAVGLAFVSV